MDLKDALGDWPSAGGNQNQSKSGAGWPGQPPNNPTWPGGQPASNPTWPGGQPASNPTWPGGQPANNPTWPGGQPANNPTWPGQPSSGPSWPGQPNQPSNPSTWPTQPSGFPGGPTPSQQPSHPAFPQTNLNVPFNQEIHGGLSDKKLITIRGVPKHNARRFNVDLCTRSGDLAFHLNPRFREEGRPVIVRNSCMNKKWGREERDMTSFPFECGKNFEIKMLVTHTCYKVAVNDRHQFEFNHRINPSNVCGIGVSGDCTLTGFNIETMH